MRWSKTSPEAHASRRALRALLSMRKMPQQDRPHPEEAAKRSSRRMGHIKEVATLPVELLERVKDETRAAAWFAALGEPLTEGDRNDATAYAMALGLGPLRVVQAHDWPEAERV